ncbi:hypothetical protein A3715_11340 [Oleiphilus sp. HI0009]|nr:hypothetical protein A3715_11340 [Oleiphilus sp. HI0009]
MKMPVIIKKTFWGVVITFGIIMGVFNLIAFSSERISSDAYISLEGQEFWFQGYAIDDDPLSPCKKMAFEYASFKVQSTNPLTLHVNCNSFWMDNGIILVTGKYMEKVIEGENIPPLFRKMVEKRS